MAVKKMTVEHIMRRLEHFADPKNAEGMVRFGISSKGTLGVPIPTLRMIAQDIGKNHDIALELWETGIHEARILAGYVDEPRCVTSGQLERWVKDFDSWDVCDQVCGNLFDRTPFAYDKAFEWSRKQDEFVKRAGFVMMACLAVHDKKAKDPMFEQFFPIIKREAHDERNFVKKAVNWALRQIGKRNPHLNDYAIVCANELQNMDSKAAKWIAADAIRELTSKQVQLKFRKN